MMNLIRPTAIVSGKALLGEGLAFGSFTVIHEGMQIRSGTRIDGCCELGCQTSLANGQELIIGCNSVIRSHSIFYQGSCFEDDLVAGHRVTVREKTKAGKIFRLGLWLIFRVVVKSVAMFVFMVTCMSVSIRRSAAMSGYFLV